MNNTKNKFFNQYIIDSINGKNLEPIEIVLPKRILNKVQKILRIKTNLSFFLTSNEIRHINNRHGKKGRRTRKGKNEILLVEKDFFQIPYVLQNPDNIDLVHNIKNGESLIFSKTMENGKLFCVVVLFKLPSDYHLKTSYKNRIDGFESEKFLHIIDFFFLYI